MTPSPPPFNTVSYVALIRATEVARLRDLTHRFDLEFTIAENVAPLDLDPADGYNLRWIALGAKGTPEQLGGLQGHAIRVEHLYENTGPNPPLEITFGYIDDLKVVRATRTNSRDRIAVGNDVWAEIVLQRDWGLKFKPPVGRQDLWTNRKAVDFFNSIH